MERKIGSDGYELEYELVFRKRKTLEIQVIPPGKVRVIAPTGASEGFILKCLEDKSAWIQKKLAEVETREREALVFNHRNYLSGEVFFFLGEEYILKLINNGRLSRAEVWLEESAVTGNSLVVETPMLEATIIKKTLEEWYKKKAMEVFTKKITYYAEKIGKGPVRIKLSNSKKRWGSCTSKGTVLLNWRLVMAPLWVVDYLVVHELCHLMHLNHGKDFWQLVAAVIPDFKVRQDWLKVNGYKFLS